MGDVGWLLFRVLYVFENFVFLIVRVSFEVWDVWFYIVGVVV